QIVEERVVDLQAHMIEQLLEVQARLAIDKVVILQLGEPGSDVVRDGIERVALVLEELAWPRLVALPIRGIVTRPILPLAEPLVEGSPLAIDDVLEPLGDVSEHGVEVVLVEQLLTLLAEALDEVAQTLPGVAIGVTKAPAERAPHGVLHVAVAEEILRHGVEEIIGIEGGIFGAVPLGVGPGGR